ncbi:MAG: hypothetical protein M5U24_00375 [Candidatus Kuenenia sp.]|uniref:Uncharacterized protein n=1 Tax=Kuenenia stuttgartiensis TaxID=174633 RepID=A0A2C9CJR3_KUEST|nr:MULTISPECIES: hypothetical protein [Kuenenia]MCZ7611937.1 hypothetical protein [Ignavibacterium sp.]MCZ7620929.1 hypothetical protein [Candidatus Kuenenia sp.]SOH05885.1 hypothetical protein KSMBR1_3411 [Candidatus Kuenenia stuttgartiensis]
MLNTLWGVVKKEKIELLEKANIPEGTRVLVTVLEMATGSDHDKLSLHKEITFKGVTFLSLNTYF